MFVKLPFHDKIREYINNFPEIRSLLLDGAPGCGKTTGVHEIAKELGYEVIEFNASDSRKKSDLEAISSYTKTSYLVPTLFLLDEADGISSIATLNKLLNDTRNPIILTANEGYKLRDLTKMCNVVKIRAIHKSNTIKILKEIDDDMSRIKEVASSDIRSSIIAMESGTKPNEKEMTNFDIASRFFCGNLEEYSPISIYWLIDNAPSFLKGRELYDFYTKFIPTYVKSDKLIQKKMQTMNAFKGRGRPEYPIYFRVAGKAKIDNKSKGE